MLTKPRHLASAIGISTIGLNLLSAAASAQTIQPGLWESTRLKALASFQVLTAPPSSQWR
jgi:hypothetical protein